MKFSARVFLIGLLCLIMVPSAWAGKPGVPTVPSVTGVYENFTVGKGSGDLEGMRVVLVAAGDGHYAIVQIAQGGAEDPKPEFVPVTVKGSKVSFAVGEQKFAGTVTATGLVLKTEGGGTESLKRRACSSYL